MDFQTKFSILIPTRNRPKELSVLLDSICESNVSPNQIVIVASGKDVLPDISKYLNKLNINYLYSDIQGQVNQKKLGLKQISPENEWVVFLDDDVTICPDTFSSAFKTITTIEERDPANIVGVGFKLTSTSRVSDASKVSKFFAKLFFLHSEELGAVLRSGQATNYQDSDFPIFTQWLNGVSMWRHNRSLNYLTLNLDTKYAACEDLIFSYRESKSGKLLFSPKSIVNFQDSTLTNYEDLEVIRSAAYNRLLFVLSHEELSKWLCAWSQVGRNIYAMITNQRHTIAYSRQLLKLSTDIFLSCLWPKLLENFSQAIRVK